MAIEIKYKEIIGTRETLIKILKIKALKLSQLPEDYVNSRNHISEFIYASHEGNGKWLWYRRKGTSCWRKNLNNRSPEYPEAILVVGKIYSEKYFKNRLKIIERCGKDLHNFNRSRKTLKKVKI